MTRQFVNLKTCWKHAYGLPICTHCTLHFSNPPPALNGQQACCFATALCYNGLDVCFPVNVQFWSSILIVFSFKRFMKRVFSQQIFWFPIAGKAQVWLMILTMAQSHLGVPVSPTNESTCTISQPWNWKAKMKWSNYYCHTSCLVTPGFDKSTHPMWKKACKTLHQEIGAIKFYFLSSDQHQKSFLKSCVNIWMEAFFFIFFTSRSENEGQIRCRSRKLINLLEVLVVCMDCKTVLDLLRVHNGVLGGWYTCGWL